MVSGLIGLLITIVIVAIVAGIMAWLIDQFLPIDERFKRLAIALVWVIAVLVVLFRALPLLGVHVA